MVTKSHAALNPVGLGRSEPNCDPFLENVPRKSSAFGALADFDYSYFVPSFSLSAPVIEKILILVVVIVFVMYLIRKIMPF